ncbi:phenylalanine--tRNA ligase subunit alpha, partial [bacterium]|nr:phenylalanine--tRNA ligase subunit alpha [bacterium]
MSEAKPRDLLELALGEVRECPDLDALDSVRHAYLGRKGKVTAGLRGVSSLPAGERPAAGQAWNRVRKELDEAITARQEALATA